MAVSLYCRLTIW